MSYTVVVERAARQALRRIPKSMAERLYNAMMALGDDPRPHGAIKMSGRDSWRIRVGQYRVIYEINDGTLIVTVLAAGPRGGVYRS